MNACKGDIAPYQAALELRWHQHESFWLDLKLIVLAVWAVVGSNNLLYERWLPDLPTRPPWLECGRSKTASALRNPEHVPFE